MYGINKQFFTIMKTETKETIKRTVIKVTLVGMGIGIGIAIAKPETTKKFFTTALTKAKGLISKS